MSRAKPVLKLLEDVQRRRMSPTDDDSLLGEEVSHDGEEDSACGNQDPKTLSKKELSHHK